MASGTRIHSDNEQLKNVEPKQGGYDLNWVFNNPWDLNALAARVTDPESGRTVDMCTTEPGVQFYTGILLGGSLKGIGGLTYEHWGAFTLEAQHYRTHRITPTSPAQNLNPPRILADYCLVYKFLPL
jgi:aldose 1-epimerase